MKEINTGQDPEIFSGNADTIKNQCNFRCHKLDSYNWLEKVASEDSCDFIEVRFKNTRKAFYHNTNKLRLKEGDIVAVEASPGHDIGIVSLTGYLVQYKMLVEEIDIKNQEFKKVYRKAKTVDIEKWKEAVSMENSAMYKARKIASDVGLEMKIGDVEYQGDNTKAIFYYIADDRVDFRKLIKVLADEFKVRIEMRQIGARQEAGRIGGIGSCGRELCCSSWITNFVSVTTNAARYQEVSINPQKLAGQCSKLKCCLNYELDAYLDAQEDFPDTTVVLETKTGKAVHQKTDVFRRLMWYSITEQEKHLITCLTVDQVKDIINMNLKGEKPDKLLGVEESAITSIIEYQNAAGLDSLTRFEDAPGQARKPRKKNFRKRFQQKKLGS